MRKSDIQNLAIEYFKSWETKDVEKITDFFSEDIVLIESNIIIKGIDSIIKHNYDALKNNIIMLDIKTYIDKYVVIGELEISIGGHVSSVAEFLTFNDDLKISKIVVYSM